MKALKCKIKIGRYSFSYVTDITIKSDIDNLTRTCEIILPRKLEWQNKEIALGNGSLLKRGDKVTMSLSYDVEPSIVYTGYLVKIKPGVRVGLVCEDEMYQMKQNSLTKSYKKVTLAKLLKDIIPSGISYKAADVNLGSLRLTKVSTAQILAYLKKEYGLYSYFRDEVLHVGLAYWPDEAKTHIFHFQKNVAANHHPEYVNADSIKLKVKAISIMPDNTKKELDLGDTSGEQRTLYFYNVDPASLKSLAEKKMAKLKYDGYKGSFLAFGEPMVQPSDIAYLQDGKVPDKNGKYMIKGNTITFGNKGFRQKIELGEKA